MVRYSIRALNPNLPDKTFGPKALMSEAGSQGCTIVADAPGTTNTEPIIHHREDRECVLKVYAEARAMSQ